MIRRSIAALTTAIVSTSTLLAFDSSAQAACPSPVPVVAHRGGTERYAENTRKAFNWASDQGAKFWETDVRFDSADTPFLLHDDTLDRTTNGSGPIADQDLSAARAAGLRTDDGQVVPSLFEFLSDVAARQPYVLLEIKADPTPEQLAKVLARLDWTGTRSRVIVMSFEPGIIAKVRAAAPDLMVGLVEDPGYRSIADLQQYEIGSYIKHAYSITAARMEEWSGPLDVYAWTVDDPSEWARMQWYRSRLDGVITNRPAAYLAWARSRSC